MLFKRRRRPRSALDEQAREVAWREFEKQERRDMVQGLGPGFGRIPSLRPRRRAE